MLSQGVDMQMGLGHITTGWLALILIPINPGILVVAVC
jgi:hypothetical protein